ncbi:hypothetical protein CERSUDRAFT_75526 [Gelatoporia subvermispora B]|uniref:Uncharacterized protein n=1 Tax=Ceriporiopsis subvermispora (strain B) TaxID=914234 RepID=M2R7A3_CERS8|nr:hypothetical protein CERSUDRAFT_75526 [Gelatoporia subvermispora B]
MSMSCSVALNLTSALQMLLIVIQSAFIAIRIYALSGGRWLISITILIFGVTGVFSYMYLTPGPQPVLNLLGVPFRQCASSDYIWTSNKYKSRSSISALADISMIAITYHKIHIKTREAGRSYSGSPISTVLLQYGDAQRIAPRTVFKLTTPRSVLLFLNIIACAAYIRYANTMSIDTTEGRSLQSITVSHFLLSLRDAAHADVVHNLEAQQGVLDSQQSSRVFGSFLTPMGESLDIGLFEGLDEGFDHEVINHGAQNYENEMMALTDAT